jgi:outer membrane protein insertion porin family
MSIKKYLFIIVIAAIAGAGCSSTKGLPANEKLYTGAKVKVEGPGLSTKQKKVLRNDLTGLTRPRPNTRFLGIPIKLNIYNMFRNKKKGLFKNLRDKFGEPPVLFSEFDLAKNNQVLQSYLENKGFFDAKVTGDTTIKGKKASASFLAQTGNQYTINNVLFPKDSSEISLSLSALQSNTLLQPGKPFDLDVIKAERIRLDAGLKEVGFYFFSPEYLLLQVDSNLNDFKVDMKLVVKEGTPQKATNVYRIHNVFIYSAYSLNTARIDTSMVDMELFNGQYIVDRRKRFKPKLLDESMQFRPGEVYSRTDHNQTLRRLINLNLFKFVKNRFEEATTDSPKLDVYYYLTPLPSKTLSGEVTAISRSNNLNGSQFTINWRHRNLFRNGSQLNIQAYIGSDIQFSGALKGYNTYRTGLQLEYAIPRFVLPFRTLASKGAFAPRTNIRLGYDILNRKNLYTLNSYRFEYGYTWRENLQKNHEFFPISIIYVQPLDVTQAYKDLEATVPGLERAIEPQFILGANYQYTYNQLAGGVPKTNSFYFSGLVDLSGNIAGLLMGANVKNKDTAKIANTPFSQYIKFETDGRYYRKVGLNSTWANRIIIGVGIPYGNSVQIPYVKQFFVGGNNSLRGFRSRSVGPGIYFPVNSKDFIPDQTGDIKLEVNTEFRPHISGPLFGAIFLEAGNIWLKNDSNYTQKPGGKFTGKFLNQLAVDAGLGIRLDLTVFVIRLDVGFPLRKPWEQNPWVLNQIDFNSGRWKRENIVYNLAIGYPF